MIIAGPCSVESKEQIDAITKFLAEKGIKYLRGGAYKPRSNPDAFQGLGKEGTRFLKDAAERYGLQTVSEVMTPEELEESYEDIDIIQIGARNMTAFGLLKAVGQKTKEDKKAVLLKRGLSSTVNELINAAKYISQYGNDNIILSLRGIRT
ncbi:MAG: chorismate mutase, partial [Nanoarchaeota archaeon]